MKKLAKVMIILTAIFVVFWRLTREDYRQFILVKASQVIADLKKLQELCDDSRDPSRDEDVVRILVSWIRLEWDTHPDHLQIPAQFEELHRVWWLPLIDQLLSIRTVLLEDGDKGRVKDAISSARIHAESYRD